MHLLDFQIPNFEYFHWISRNSGKFLFLPTSAVLTMDVVLLTRPEPLVCSPLDATRNLASSMLRELINGALWSQIIVHYDLSAFWHHLQPTTLVAVVQ